MIKLKRILAPADGTDFDNICSFTTETYVGIWNHCTESFMMFAKEDSEFNCVDLGRPETLDELDDAVYEECKEHIDAVSALSNYEFKLKC